MVARTSQFRTVDAAEDATPATDLVCSSDDFSVKVSSPSDGRFWVRLEREVEGGTLVITDFNPGGRPIVDLEAGLSMAVRALGVANVCTIVFRDLVPGGEQVVDYPAKVVRAADLVKRLGAAVALKFHAELRSFDMQSRRGKIDGIVLLSN